MDPAVRWRVLDSRSPAPPEPWPSRVDAFLVACAVHAGERERELLSVMEALGGLER